jgi:hypothetical protein
MQWQMNLTNMMMRNNEFEASMNKEERRKARADEGG